MIIEFRCKMCGRLATRDVESYKEGMNVCDRCVSNSEDGESVNIHINRLGACL